MRCEDCNNEKKWVGSMRDGCMVCPHCSCLEVPARSKLLEEALRHGNPSFVIGDVVRPRQLKPEYEDRIANFRSSDCGQIGCRCHMGCAPCGWCTHEDNPHNIEEDDEAWED